MTTATVWNMLRMQLKKTVEVLQIYLQRGRPARKAYEELARRGHVPAGISAPEQIKDALKNFSTTVRLSQLNVKTLY